MMPSEQLRAMLSDEQRAIHDWLYEQTRSHAFSTLLVAFIVGYAAEHPQATAWECLAAARERLRVVSASSLEQIRNSGGA